MKKLFIVFILVVLSMCVYGQGFYFDIGGGAGLGWTNINGLESTSIYKLLGYKIDADFSTEFGFKAGYGPFGNIPLYIAGELTWLSHIISGSIKISEDVTKFVSTTTKPIIFGIGVLFYPIPLIQLGTSFCLAYSGFIGDSKFFAAVSDLADFDDQLGFAWNISLAVDLGKKNHGCLIGIKYWYEDISRKESVNTHALGFFIKYAFRKKAPSLF